VQVLTGIASTQFRGNGWSLEIETLTSLSSPTVNSYRLSIVKTGLSLTVIAVAEAALLIEHGADMTYDCGVFIARRSRQ